MDIQKEREAFEAWAKEETGLRLDVESDGNYDSALTFFAWEAWQAAKAQAVPELISVQDRMPEQGQKVFVFRPDAHNHPHKDPNFKICTYAGADIFINSHFEHVITHWMPLPQEPSND
ncbi:DUF551 domain-containing protein [Acinetobacter thermotolerans]|uniref:DUF551 domain-containing protein n=1 Tax=Acinetobacter thermotolerans TaxID=3151487 RepID=UPI00325BD8F2